MWFGDGALLTRAMLRWLRRVPVGVWLVLGCCIWAALGVLLAEDLRCGFACGLGVAFGLRFVLEQIGHAGEGECFGLGLHEFAACAGDGLDGAFGDAKLLGVDDGVELGEREFVVVAQIEHADGRVEEVLEQVVGEFGRIGVGGMLMRIRG